MNLLTSTVAKSPLRRPMTRARGPRIEVRDEIESGIWRCQYSRNSAFFVVLDGHEDRVKLPANGGLRLWPYMDENQALADGKVLSRRMSWKHRLYDTGFSGVKIVAQGDPENPAQKSALLNALADLLNELKGAVYTGCDLNTNNADMENLNRLTPYVLSGLNSPTDVSSATGYGVYGCIKSCLVDNKQPLDCLVHGVGKVGSPVARLLQEAGHRVLTFDLETQAADLPGCINVSEKQDWWRMGCDLLVLCSTSYLITERMALELDCRLIVSGANSPFASEKVEEILNDRGIAWIPDVIANAGAVICDSVEHYAPGLFLHAEPGSLHEFVQSCVASKTSEFIGLREETGLTPRAVLDRFLETEGPSICGNRFQGWLEDRR